MFWVNYNDLTVLPHWELWLIRGIIPFYGLTIQVSEILFHLPRIFLAFFLLKSFSHHKKPFHCRLSHIGLIHPSQVMAAMAPWQTTVKNPRIHPRSKWRCPDSYDLGIPSHHPFLVWVYHTPSSLFFGTPMAGCTPPPNGAPLCQPAGCKFQWIGLRENLQETIDFPINYGAFL